MTESRLEERLSRVWSWNPPIRGGSRWGRIPDLRPSERDQLGAIQEWLRLTYRTPYNGLIPGELFLALRRTPGATGLETLAGGRPIYTGYPLSGRPVEIYPIAFDDLGASIAEDRPYVLTRIRRKVLSGRRARLFSVYWIEDYRHAGAAEFLNQVTMRQSLVDQSLHALVDELGTEPSFVEQLVLPFVGSPPRPGSGGGLDASFGAPATDVSDAHAAMQAISGLLPAWAIPEGPAQFWGGSVKFGPILRPYDVRIGRFRQARSVAVHAPGVDNSALLYDGVTGRSVLSMIYGADLPILRTRSEVAALGLVQPDPGVLIAASDAFVCLHRNDPALPEGNAILENTSKALTEIEGSASTLLQEAGLSERRANALVRARPSISQSVIRDSLARARLRGERTVAPDEPLRVAKAFSDSVATFLREATRDERRRVVVENDLLLSRKELAKRVAVESAVRESTDATAEQLWDHASLQRDFSSFAEFVGYLDELERKGYVIRPRAQGYRWLG